MLSETNYGSVTSISKSTLSQWMKNLLMCSRLPGHWQPILHQPMSTRMACREWRWAMPSLAAAPDKSGELSPNHKVWLEESSHIWDKTPLKFTDRSYLFVVYSPSTVLSNGAVPGWAQSFRTCYLLAQPWPGCVDLSCYLRASDLSSQEEFHDELMLISAKHTLKHWFCQGTLTSCEVEALCPTLKF